MNKQTRTVFYVRVDGVDIHAYDNKHEAEHHAQTLSQNGVVGRGDHMASVEAFVVDDRLVTPSVNVVETKVIGGCDYPEMVNNKA